MKLMVVFGLALLSLVGLSFVGGWTEAEIVSMKVVSYNIKHGEGNDGKVDLDRTAAALKKLNPDIVGLQEVDKNAGRSGEVDQAAFLGKQLGMEHAFGAFMDFDGGEYGMGILSKYPIKRVEPLRLPEGNEPRVALVAEVELPGGERMLVVNVHFDWVADDGFRFAQATKLAEYLKGQSLPYVLLGDFNDEPGSRTLKLFQGMAKEARKPEGDRFTFPSTGPSKEIDFLFVSPAERWAVGEVSVVKDDVTSDHCAVSAGLVLKQ